MKQFSANHPDKTDISSQSFIWNILKKIAICVFLIIAIAFKPYNAKAGCYAYFYTSVSGDTVRLENYSSAGTGDSIIFYYWTFGDGSDSYDINPTHVYSKSGNDTICLTIYTKSGCSNNLCRTVTVTVNGSGSCSAYFNTTINDDTGQFNNYSTAGARDTIIYYEWSFGDGTYESGKSPTHIYSKTGTDTVCLSIYTKLGGTHTPSCSYCRTVSVTAKAGGCDAYFYYTITGGDTVQFSNYSTVGSGDSVIYYSWHFGDGTSSLDKNPVHVFNNSGIDTVCLYMATKNGCSSGYCRTLTITVPHGSCSAYFNTTITGDTVQFNNYSYAGTGDSILYYSWSFGDGTNGSGKNPTHIYTKSGTDTACLSVYTKIGGTHSPSCYYCRSFAMTVKNTSCYAYFYEKVSGDTVTFTNYSKAGVGDSIIYFSWSFGDGTYSHDINPTHIYTKSGTDTACLYISTKDGCTSSLCRSFTVTANNTACNAYFLVSVPSDTATFTNYSKAGSGDSITYYVWVFGDGDYSHDLNPTHVYSKSGTDTACLYISTKNGCTSNFCRSFTVTVPSTSCDAYFYGAVSADTLKLTNYSKAASSDSIIYYLWTFGDGSYSHDINPTHIYDQSGTDTVCLTIYTKEGCTSNMCRYFTVTAKNTSCYAYFYVSVKGDTARFTNYSKAGAGDSIIYYVWSFGDGNYSHDLNPVHVYSKPGSDTACLYIYTKDGCSSSLCRSFSITVNGGCSAYFNFSIAGGDTVQFNNYSKAASGDSIIYYSWYFGDGTHSLSKNPVHVFDLTGTDTVCLYTATKNGCSSSYCRPVTVTTNCHAYFYDVINGDSVSFYNYSTTNAGDTIKYYAWSFGDGTFSQDKNPNHKYAGAGTDTVCLAIYSSSGCYDIYCRVITINANTIACNAYFNTTIVNDTVLFNNYSTAGVGDSIIYMVWTFGDGTYSHDENPIHVYNGNGTDTVCLYISTKNGCTSSYCSAVILTSGSCQAYFTENQLGDTLNFTNQSYSTDSIINYVWYFGDSVVSFDKNASHIYLNNGKYNVCLFIYTMDGCASGYCDTVYVEEKTGVKLIQGVNSIVSNIFPNPTNDDADILIQTAYDADITLEVKNILGQNVYYSTMQVPSGKSLINIPSGSLVKGMYFVEMNINNTAIVVRKLIKE